MNGIWGGVECKIFRLVKTKKWSQGDNWLVSSMDAEMALGKGKSVRQEDVYL